MPYMSWCAGVDQRSCKWAADVQKLRHVPRRLTTLAVAFFFFFYICNHQMNEMLSRSQGACCPRALPFTPNSPSRRSPILLNSLSSDLTCFSPSSVCCTSLSLIPSLHHCLPPSICHAFRCGVKNTCQMRDTAGFCLLLLLVFLATFSPDLTHPDRTYALKVHQQVATQRLGDPRSAL